MSAPILTPLSAADRVRVVAARQALAAAEAVTLGDVPAMARTIGRLEAAVTSLLTLIEGGDQS